MLEKICISCKEKIKINQNFCKICKNSIDLLLIKPSENSKSINLFKNEEPIHSLLISAKHPQSANYFIYKALIKNYIHHLNISSKITHVTWVPSKNKHKQHAKYIAKLIAKIYCLKLVNILKNNSKAEAKNLSLKERNEFLDFSLKKSYRLNNLLIVDDIETSGTTFLKIVELFNTNVYTFTLARTDLR